MSRYLGQPALLIYLPVGSGSGLCAALYGLAEHLRDFGWYPDGAQWIGVDAQGHPHMPQTTHGQLPIAVHR
jgi:hypothetical protein